MEEIKYERLPEKMKLRFDPRRSTAEDIPGVMEIVRQAQRYLRESGTDQWQDGYPNEDVLRSDVERGRGWVFECEGRIAGYVCISMDVEASYAHIDGRWLTEGGNYAVVHRSMVGDDSAAPTWRRRCSPSPSTSPPGSASRACAWTRTATTKP